MEPEQYIDIETVTLWPPSALDLHRITRDLDAEIDDLQQQVVRRGHGFCTKTLVDDRDLSAVLFAMRCGSRVREDRLGGSIHVLAGHLVLHVGKHCGDLWDLLPYWIRNTEGACSFFALEDNTIELTCGALVALDADRMPDIEAIADSTFIREVHNSLH